MTSNFKFILLPLFTLFILSCDNQPKCSDPFQDIHLRLLIEEELLDNKAELAIAQNLFDDPNFDAEKYVSKYALGLDFVNTKTTRIDEQLKLCECSTELEFDFEQYSNSKVKKEVLSVFKEKGLFEHFKQMDVEVYMDYSIQNNDSDSALYELYIPDEIYSQFVQFMFIQYMLDQSDDIAELEGYNNEEEEISDSFENTNNEEFINTVSRYENDQINLFYSASNDIWDNCYYTNGGTPSVNLAFDETTPGNVKGIYATYPKNGISWGGEFDGKYNDDKTEIVFDTQWKGSESYYDVTVKIEILQNKVIVNNPTQNYSNEDTEYYTLERGICDEEVSL